MRLISLDQSTTAVGLGFFVDGKLTDYSLIKPKASKKAEKVKIEEIEHQYNIVMPEEEYGVTLLRIAAITDLLDSIISKFKPDEIWFEEVFESRNPKGYRSLARLQGFIAHLCHTRGIKYTIEEETTWITAWGTYTYKDKRPQRKEDVRRKVNEYYNLDIQVDDISDAIGIGRYAILQEEKEK